MDPHSAAESEGIERKVLLQSNHGSYGGGGWRGGAQLLNKVLYWEASSGCQTPYPFIYHFWQKKVLLSYTFVPSIDNWYPIPFKFCRCTVFWVWILALFSLFTDRNDRFAYPFSYFSQLRKSLPFCIPEAWQRNPFQAEPPCIGHKRNYPPPPQRGLLLQLTDWELTNDWGNTVKFRK